VQASASRTGSSKISSASSSTQNWSLSKETGSYRYRKKIVWCIGHKRGARSAHVGAPPRHHAQNNSGVPIFPQKELATPRISRSPPDRGDPERSLATARSSRATSLPDIGILSRSAQNLGIPHGEKRPEQIPQTKGIANGILPDRTAV
jgi:hypothetical protein